MIQLITDRIRWDVILKNMDISDFYHTYEYHYFDRNDEDKPVLLYYSENNSKIAIPLLIRKVPGTDYFDATSVSGYAGPITSHIGPDFDNSNFRKELQDLLEQERIVSVFSRLNPFVPNQETCLTNIGETTTMGDIVTIDLEKPLEEQRKAYQKRLKTYINKTRRLCQAKIENTPDGLMEFMNLYNETMVRVKATPRYFFPKSYFEGLMQSEEFTTEIWLARENETGKAIAGAMIVKKNRLVHYHLAGAKSDFWHLNPAKLIIDEVRIQATKQDFSVLNLGGGVGSRQDSLFRFKNSFSKDTIPFKVWKYIVDVDVYADLVSKKHRDFGFFVNNDCQDYFPLYRCSRPGTNAARSPDILLVGRCIHM
ncbi:peptidoglycan bridge formation glycyltransferase FemA/FemB family protein [Poritiphilus flavus]|uniref:Peptidoglycan bridge formation glycyltransferase FemA/FemB family protein n=1 Tax=Poritiphilus flavus TaxID=2697053 RepID=A0A6L9EGU3_9FLAO|nr:peptidoglycan bridge formation glycyltransferase FemA/FemB family protein [Poritiphilus flavus]NAS13866.1 peptidoglycan bridge formation glycyltransferase FemA/FemB family protein [Poritiphilus flavus]